LNHAGEQREILADIAVHCQSYTRREIKKKKHDINIAGKLPKKPTEMYMTENIIFTTNFDLLESLSPVLVKKELSIPF
jgi:hypothetical protein